MRISDWSSDVCSSDLPVPSKYFPGAIVQRPPDAAWRLPTPSWLFALKRKAPVASSPRRLAHGQADFRGRRSDPDSGRAQRLDLARGIALSEDVHRAGMAHAALGGRMQPDRKTTRLTSSH